uniref:V-set and transmembrane domain containing 1 n=1 Tax=Rhinolophus ferrumequinum TaxID=59479 RepID=A0A671EJ32_RHIFE
MTCPFNLQNSRSEFVVIKMKSQTNSDFFPEKLPKPSLSALPRSVVERSSNVTLKCQCHFQNVTFMLGKLQDSGYEKEQSSAGHDAEFLLMNLEPKNAGTYFCAYKITGSHEWSEKSEHLQLVVTDGHDGPGASSIKTDTRIIFVTTFSCLIIFLLFPSVFLIYRCTQHGSSHEESNKRTSHSKFPQQEASGKRFRKNPGKNHWMKDDSLTPAILELNFFSLSLTHMQIY